MLYREGDTLKRGKEYNVVYFLQRNFISHKRRSLSHNRRSSSKATFLSKPSSVSERDEANEDEVKNSSFVINFFCKYLNSAH